MTNSPKRVLLVDDFEDSRFSLSKLLEIEGYEVLEAGDGAQAVELALDRKPDLILMDIELADGVSAASERGEVTLQSSRTTSDPATDRALTSRNLLKRIAISFHRQ